MVQPHEMKLGKGGTLQSRIAILHSLANIEQFAIDLGWDIIARFSDFKLPDGQGLPKAFFDDFVQLAADEAKHYTMLARRLSDLGANFGDLPVHHGLWQSATETAKDILARLCVVHMVHEARGLDVMPNTLLKFERNGDPESVAMLREIYEEEITHVTFGQRWFTFITEERGIDPVATFHELVRAHFHGPLKPPFNDKARAKAGMTAEWYMPLVRSTERA